MKATSAGDLTRLVPGFDFLQGLMKGGGAALPGIGQWIAPTLDPAELQKRIDELRTVQFWLDQNSKLLGTTIQALEVQRMTLATLKGMNMPLADLTEALKFGGPAPATPATVKAPDAAPASAPAPRHQEAAAKAASRERIEKGAAPKTASQGVPAVDPMQWWGALTQQFTELATKALKDGGAEMARNLAGAAAKQGLAAAGDSIERAMAISGRAAGVAAGRASKAAARTAAKPRSARPAPR